MDYKLEDIVDIPLLQELQDKLNVIYSFPSAIIDNDAKVLTAVAWQDICTKFHRIHPECEKECIKSDKYIADHLHEANPAVSYECPHGLIDNATPIIIDGKHLGNFFTGQFFLEKPDLEFFKKQAQKYAFDEKAYLEAVEKVPIWSKEKLMQYLDFIKGFIEIIASIGLKNLREIETNSTLKESEEHFRMLFEKASDGIMYLTFDSEITEYNESFAKMHGYTVKEMRDIKLQDLDVEDLSKVVPERLQRLANGEDIKFDVKHYHKDGHIIDLEVTATLIDLNNKKFIVTFHRDITERKLMEQSLHESEERYRNLFEGAPDAIFLADLETGIILDANQSASRLLGRSIEEIIGMHQEQLHPSKLASYSKDTFKQHIEESATLGHTFPVEHVVLCADGTQVPIEVLGQTIYINGKELLMGTFRDISKRKQAEKMLQDIIDKNPMAIQILDMDGFTIHTNSAHTALFGAITPSDYSILKDQQLLKQGFGELFDRIKNGEVVSFPDSYYNAHNVDPSFPDITVAVKAIGFTLNDSNEIPERIVLMQENITERKQAEKILQDIIDKNPMSIQIVDKDGFTIQGNPAYLELFGSIPPPDFSIFADLESKSPELKELILRAKSGEVVHFPDLYYNPHDISSEFPDNPVWIRALLFSLNDSSGKPERFVFMHENITYHKLAVDALKESESRFRTFIEQSPLAIGVFNLEGFGLYSNPKFLEILGLDCIENMIGKPAFEFFVPQYREESKERTRRRLEGLPVPTHYESRCVCADGSEFPVHLAVGSIQLADGKVSIAFLTDISDRKQAEEALNESEQQYRNLANSGMALVWTSDKDKLCNYFNQPWLNFTGRTLEQEMGNGWAEGVHPDDFERCLDLFVTSFDKREKFYMEYRLRHVSGEYRWISDLGTPNFNSSGEFLGYIGHCFDITERRKTEEALKESEEKLSSLFASMTEMVVMHELVFNEKGEAVNYRILDCNNAFTKTTGIKRENAIGKLANEVYQTELPPYLDEFARVGITGESYEFTTYFAPMELHFAISVVSPKKNQFSTVTSNITDRKKAEQELQSQNMEIEAQYEEYMQLNEVLRQTNYDLELAKDHAEQSDKLKSTFLQNMSHEIRTPLNGIMGFSALLKDFDELTIGERTEYINLIIGSSERLLDMIDDVLIISSLDSKIINLDKSEFKLSELISDFQSLYYANAKSKGLKYNIKVPKNCSELFITTDKNKLYQIITNLLNNALKFTNKGEIELGVIRNEETFKLYVKDTGIGIKPEFIDKIYDRFWQYEAFTKDFYGGTGLGLAITSGLAYLLEIDISVESEYGVGTTFTLTLKSDSVKDVAIDTTIAAVKNNVQIAFNDLNILIVEDEETNFSYLNTLLRKVGAKSDLAKDGREAIEMTEKKEYDLILMDLKMPVMDGFEATRQIRSKNKDVFIIAQSAYTQSEEKERALEAGCNAYIIKPIRIDEFYNAINQVTKSKKE